jgi:crotonobetainyl-CoA:carnitine CoA-transferase CaiB-like acyl-CoA transferase
MPAPLAGIRVLDFTMVISGPLCTQWLADQGADVVKVEPPGAGDMTRGIYTQRAGVTALFLNLNRNKRSVAIDLKSDAGREALIRMAEQADVLVENFRPGRLERYGLGYADLHAKNPGLIYTSIRGLGESGPDADQPVYDALIQGRSGMIASQESANGRRDIVRNFVCDKVTSIVAAQAITAALFARERGAGGQHLHLSMLDTAIAFLWPDAFLNQTFLGEGADPQPPIGSAIRLFETQGGHLMLSPTQPKHVEALLRALGRPQLLEDPRFESVATRIAHIEEWNDALQSLLAGQETAKLAARLEADEVPFCVVSDLDEVLDDRQVRANELMVELRHASAGRYRQPRHPTLFDGTPGPAPLAAPALGEHTEDVLREAGFASEEIERMRTDGAFGDTEEPTRGT